MTDDLVKRLRAGYCSDNDSDEAADRIEKLEAALRDTAQHVCRSDWNYLKPETIAVLEEDDALLP